MLEWNQGAGCPLRAEAQTAKETVTVSGDVGAAPSEFDGIYTF